jgi:1,3-beta-glucan synthase
MALKLSSCTGMRIAERFERCVLSTFIVFFISFVPFVVQGLMVCGFWRAVIRSAKFAPTSPVLEAFRVVCQSCTSLMQQTLSFGEACCA